MKFALIGTVLAWLAVVVGIALAVAHALRRRPAPWLLWAHPILAVATAGCVWTATVLWPGANDLPFNSGALIVTLAFIAGVFMFVLRTSGLRPPVIATGLHGIVALVGCVLLLVGLSQMAAAAG